MVTDIRRGSAQKSIKGLHVRPLLYDFNQFEADGFSLNSSRFIQMFFASLLRTDRNMDRNISALR